MVVFSQGMCDITCFGSTLLPGTIHRWEEETSVLGVFNNYLLVQILSLEHRTILTKTVQL